MTTIDKCGIIMLMNSLQNGGECVGCPISELCNDVQTKLTEKIDDYTKTLGSVFPIIDGSDPSTPRIDPMNEELFRSIYYSREDLAKQGRAQELEGGEPFDEISHAIGTVIAIENSGMAVRDDMDRFTQAVCWMGFEKRRQAIEHLRTVVENFDLANTLQVCESGVEYSVNETDVIMRRCGSGNLPVDFRMAHTLPLSIDTI